MGPATGAGEGWFQGFFAGKSQKDERQVSIKMQDERWHGALWFLHLVLACAQAEEPPNLRVFPSSCYLAEVADYCAGLGDLDTVKTAQKRVCESVRKCQQSVNECHGFKISKGQPCESKACCGCLIVEGTCPFSPALCIRIVHKCGFFPKAKARSDRDPNLSRLDQPPPSTPEQEPWHRTISLQSGARVVVIDNAMPKEVFRDWWLFLSATSNKTTGSTWYRDIGTKFINSIPLVENIVLGHDDVGHPNLANSDSSYEGASIAKRVEAHIRDLFIRHGFQPAGRLTRSYTNYVGILDRGMLHVDDISPGTVTALWFSHSFWEPNWGGEFLVYDLDETAEKARASLQHDSEASSEKLQSDAISSVGRADIRAFVPLANRVILMDSAVVHAARPPQAKATRLSTAFKFAARLDGEETPPDGSCTRTDGECGVEL